MVDGMLQFRPADRLKVMEVLMHPYFAQYGHESEVVEAVWRNPEDHSPAMSRRTVGTLYFECKTTIIKKAGGRRTGLGLSNGPVTSSVASSRAREPRRPARSGLQMEQEVGKNI